MYYLFHTLLLIVVASFSLMSAAEMKETIEMTKDLWDRRVSMWNMSVQEGPNLIIILSSFAQYHHSFDNLLLSCIIVLPSHEVSISFHFTSSTNNRSLQHSRHRYYYVQHSLRCYVADEEMTTEGSESKMICFNHSWCCFSIPLHESAAAEHFVLWRGGLLRHFG